METNKEYTYSLSQYAIEDVNNIILFYQSMNNQAGAERIEKKIVAALSQLTVFPYSAPKMRDRKLADMGFRMLVIEKYLLIYRVFDESSKIMIYRVLNAKQDYSALINRYFGQN